MTYSRLLPPPYATWPRKGAVLAALLGLAVGVYVEWYFSSGPGLINPDRGEAHALIATVLGLPFTLLPWQWLGEFGGRVGLVSAAAAWAIVGTAVGAIAALVVARIRGDDSWAHPPAG